MAYTVWSLITFVFLPSGLLLASLLLSGFESLERLAQRVCRCEVQWGGVVSATLPAIIVFVCSLCFGGEWVALQRLRSYRERPALIEPPEFNASWRASLWRHQRNWWLALCSLTLWLIIWRCTVMIEDFRAKVAAIEKERIAILKQQAVPSPASPATGAPVQAKSNRQKKRD